MGALPGPLPGPLLVFGPNSTRYDFGPSHPLTPRRFGPGIDLLEAVGARPGLAPEPAPDVDLLMCHSARYLGAVRRLSADPWGPPEAGIGPGGDNPSFAGMHDAGAAVAGGSLRAVEAILRGDVEHAFHPGGGLHHALRDSASGFCIYDDPALAISRVRREDLRVLYLDFDVHHGDGVQAIHWSDPGVLTLSFHESGRYLFPGTGFLSEIGEGEAAGTSLNMPFEPEVGEDAWLRAVSALVPAVAAAFGPDVVVSQHGADTHAWDPLAHLRLTTTAMGEAARLVDRVAHRWSAGRWLSTGGGGYDAYRVVPRTWSLVWLAGAHLPAPDTTPVPWRDRWAAEAARYGQAPMPARFDDEPNASVPVDGDQRAAEGASLAGLGLVEMVAVPALLREAGRRGWWSATEDLAAGSAGVGLPLDPGDGAPTIRASLTADDLGRLTLAPRVVAPFDAAAAQDLLTAALTTSDSIAAAAIAGDTIVGLAVAGPSGAPRQLLALGVAPAYRRRGLAGELLRALTGQLEGEIEAVVTVAERDAVEPLDHELRSSIARRLLERAGFDVQPADAALTRVDPFAIRAVRR